MIGGGSPSKNIRDVSGEGEPPSSSFSTRLDRNESRLASLQHGPDRVTDLLIAGASTEIGPQPLDHGLTVGVGMAGQKRMSCGEKSRGAVAALEGPMVHKCVLQGRMVESFDSGNLVAYSFGRQH